MRHLFSTCLIWMGYSIICGLEYRIDRSPEEILELESLELQLGGATLTEFERELAKFRQFCWDASYFTDRNSR